MSKGRIIHGECVQVLENTFPDSCVDLVVTSPPYDSMRSYNGYIFRFEKLVEQLYRVVKDGGVVVWVVNDETVEGCETGNSFRQALYFMETGFRLFDTMIYDKGGAGGARGSNYSYWQSFEYMFVFSKGMPKQIHLLEDKVNVSHTEREIYTTKREKSGKIVGRKISGIKEFGRRTNVWRYSVGSHSSSDRIAFEHPAIFPEKLAEDHILSWSKEGDLVLDPMCGSGTTCKMAKKNQRRYVGIDISEKYCRLARRRVRGEDEVGSS